MSIDGELSSQLSEGYIGISRVDGSWFNGNLLRMGTRVSSGTCPTLAS